MQRTFHAPGLAVIAQAFADTGRDYSEQRERDRIERQIAQLRWLRPGEPALSAAGHPVRIARLLCSIAGHLGSVSAIAVEGTLRCPDGPTSSIPCPLIGIEGMHRGLRTRLYLLELGSGLVALARDENVTAASGASQNWFSARNGASAQAAELAAQYPAAGTALDDTVHEYASRAASAVNNDGTAAQIAYLLEWGLPEADIRALLSA